MLLYCIVLYCIVKADTVIPKNWQEFLRVAKIKKELFNYLVDMAVTIGIDHAQVISTKEDAVVSNAGVPSCRENQERELFNYLVDMVAVTIGIDHAQVISTKEDAVVSNANPAELDLSP